jgi:uncharacterized protein (TIGR02118 family)
VERGTACCGEGNLREKRDGSASGHVQNSARRGRFRQALHRKTPGARKYEVSKGGGATPGGPAPYHLIAILHFDDMAAIQKAFGSAEGQVAVADVQTFATGGADIFMFESADA